MLSQLSDGAITILLTIATLLGGAVGFFVKRSVTSAKAHERASLLNSLADLKVKMRTAGVDLAEISAMEGIIRQDGSLSAPSAAAVIGTAEVTPTEEQDNLPSSYWTTVAMRGRAAARYNVVDAELEEALIELHTLISDEQQEALNASHEAWLEYRRHQISFAGERYSGGTMGPLVGTLRGIEVTERRVSELRAEVEGLKSEEL